MNLNLRAIAKSIRESSTEELLDRVTVYREGMEPAALDLIEGELSRRGFNSTAISDHEAERKAQGLLLIGGVAWPCSRCNRPAVRRAWTWLRLARWIPVLPWRLRFCQEHDPAKQCKTH
jgi:hypothetical protein